MTALKSIVLAIACGLSGYGFYKMNHGDLWSALAFTFGLLGIVLSVVRNKPLRPKKKDAVIFKSPSVLHVCPRHSFSGLESWVFDMLCAQREGGASVALVALAGSPLEKKALSAGLRVYSTPTESAWALSKAVSAGTDGMAAEIIHLHGGQDFKKLLLWIAARRALGTMPLLILQLHIWLSHSKKDPFHWFSYRWIDQIWCSSELAKAEAARLLPTPKNKLHLLRYGRPLAAMQAGMLSREAARAELKLPADAIVLGTVSRIDRGKGHLELLRAASALMRDESNVFLALIGPPTDDEKERAFAADLEREAKALPADISSRIRFYGAVPQSYRVLRAFDLFVSSSYGECFALALLEAQLAGLPCVATFAGGTPEIVRDGEMGWLCAPKSIESLKSALKAALDGRDRWEAFGDCARRRVLKEFDAESVLKETLLVYRAALSGLPRGLTEG